VLGEVLTKGSPENAGMSSARLSRIDTVFEQYVDQGELPGAVVLVARHGKIVHLGSYGFQDAEAKIPMQEDSIFRIASQTKAIVSVGIMILQEEGKLLIGDDLGKYIPEFNETFVAQSNSSGGYDIVPAKRKITLRDLLRHTSGISYGTELAKDAWEEAGIQGWYFADRDEPILETVKRMAKLPFDAQPGERHVYGYSTDILGAVIEVVSGQSLDVFLKDRILGPLGMKDTHFYLPREKAKRLSVVYAYSPIDGLSRSPVKGGMTGQGAYLDGPRKSFSGGAGFLSTPMDYAIFLQTMLNDGEYNGVRILSRKSVELMTMDHLPPETPFPNTGGPWVDGTGFGLGFSVAKNIGQRGTPGSVGEFSWSGAYHTVYWVDPVEELVVAYFTQVRPARGLNDRDKLRALVYQAIDD